MDTDWCLTCDCHFEGTGPYCSSDCQDRAGPSTFAKISPFQSRSEIYDDSEEEDDDDEVIYHQVDDAEPKTPWTGNGSAGILAWAAEIPPTPSTGTSTPVSEFYAPSPSSSKVPSRNGSSTRLCRPPKLLRPHQRPVAPTLCMFKPTPAPPSPSRPILTPTQHAGAVPLSRSAESNSMGKTSLLSGATESSLATPASAHAVPIMTKGERPSILGAIATHVRSWVSPSPPLIASPSHSHLKQRITTTKSSEPHKFTILAHTHHSAALNIAFSSQASSEASPQWHLASTILVDTPTKSRAKLASVPPPTRSRGRKLSRAV